MTGNKLLALTCGCRLDPTTDLIDSYCAQHALDRFLKADTLRADPYPDPATPAIALITARKLIDPATPAIALITARKLILSRMPELASPQGVEFACICGYGIILHSFGPRGPVRWMHYGLPEKPAESASVRIEMKGADGQECPPYAGY